jgi:hypothetical protein
MYVHSNELAASIGNPDAEAEGVSTLETSGVVEAMIEIGGGNVGATEDTDGTFMTWVASWASAGCVTCPSAIWSLIIHNIYYPAVVNQHGRIPLPRL